MTNIEKIKGFKLKKGVILSRYRIFIYEELLKYLRKAKKERWDSYMCLLINDILCETIPNKIFLDLTLDDKILYLPELAKQRPADADYSWYPEEDNKRCDKRIKNVKDAISLWNKKYKKPVI